MRVRLQNQLLVQIIDDDSEALEDVSAKIDSQSLTRKRSLGVARQRRQGLVDAVRSDADRGETRHDELRFSSSGSVIEGRQDFADLILQMMRFYYGSRHRGAAGARIQGELHWNRRFSVNHEFAIDLRIVASPQSKRDRLGLSGVAVGCRIMQSEQLLFIIDLHHEMLD